MGTFVFTRSFRRNSILEKWDADCTQYLSLEACLGDILQISSSHFLKLKKSQSGLLFIARPFC